LISFNSESEDKEQETLNLGQTQILMNICQEIDSLAAIRVLLPTPISQEALDAVKKSEIKITTDWQ
jgi:hypothetical protein